MQREITRELVRRLLPGRMAESNKGSYGSVLAAAGSMAYRGAAALCTEGALRGGAGLVYLASVEPVIQLVLSRTPECCACGCRTAANGGIHPQDADALRRWFADRHAVLLAGPGLGESAADVCKALLGRNAPWAGAVLDADALNALAAGKYRGDLPANTILTPHPGEAARLLGTTVAEIQADRAQAARQLAEKQGRPRMSAQAVGGAVGHNKISIIIPCHRVVGTSGSLTGYAGGIDRKVKLLALEQADMTRFFVPKTGTALL